MARSLFISRTPTNDESSAPKSLREKIALALERLKPSAKEVHVTSSQRITSSEAKNNALYNLLNLRLEHLFVDTVASHFNGDAKSLFAANKAYEDVKPLLDSVIRNFRGNSDFLDQFTVSLATIVASKQNEALEQLKAGNSGDDEKFSAWNITRISKLPRTAIPYSQGKASGETVLAYFERVWGPFRDAGLLYQDDIADLGDPNLVKTVRTHCNRVGRNADEILPPLGAQRDKDELAAIDPNSNRAAYLRTLLGNRKRKQKQRTPD